MKTIQTISRTKLQNYKINNTMIYNVIIKLIEMRVFVQKGKLLFLSRMFFAFFLAYYYEENTLTKHY